MWSQLISALVGGWLMASPSIMGFGRPLATSDWIVGPLIASFGLIAASEVTRAARWGNFVLAAWVVLSPVILGDLGNVAIAATHVVSGLFVGSLSLRRGRSRHSYSGGWRSLAKPLPHRP
jgi:hypothetical protein